MLALGMAFIGRLRLLLIGEFALGLAPAVVAQLLPDADSAARSVRRDRTVLGCLRAT